MRQVHLCGEGIRLEIFQKMGVSYASITVNGDLQECEAAPFDPNALQGVLTGKPYHFAGPSWICSLERQDGAVAIDLWRDGCAKKVCKVPLSEFEQAVASAPAAFMA